MVLSGEQEGPSSVTHCSAVKCGEAQCFEVKFCEVWGREVR